MDGNERYLSSNLTITEEYLEKFKKIYVLPGGKSDKDFRLMMQSTLTKFLTFNFIEIDKLLNHTFKNESRFSAQALFNYKPFHEYYLNNLNNYLKLLINEISGIDSYTKEFNNQTASCLINCISGSIEDLVSNTINYDKPEDLLRSYSTIQLKLKSNKKLLSKLENGHHNDYLSFLSHSIEYLNNIALVSLKERIDPLLIKSNLIGVDLSNSKRGAGENPLLAVPDESSTGLKTMFKDGTVYDAILELMLSKKLITRKFDGLEWHGLQRNRKYEIVTFCDVLCVKGLLNTSVNDYNIMSTILTDTFIGFTISDKTFRNKRINVLRSEYEDILSAF
jgi:hypothetical protein